MPLEAADWNVVIIGRWNRAILTPSGIAKRLFQVTDETPLEVLVPLDQSTPPHVKLGDIIVVAGSDRLLVQSTAHTFAGLSRAMEIARRAIESLPETPLSAAGMNVRFKSTESIEALQRITSHEMDSRLSDEGFKIRGRSIRRTVEWKDGQINISVDSDMDDHGGQTYTIMLNFHRGSSSIDELKTWLSASDQSPEAESRKLLLNYIGIEWEAPSEPAS